MIGEELHLKPEDVDALNWAALVHDVGKLKVRAEILNKDGTPTDEEWVVLRQHAEFGEELVAPLQGWLGEWADAVGQHHERWDGLGYPRNLSGDEISLAARIVAVADVFDVITSARSYKHRPRRRHGTRSQSVQARTSTRRSCVRFSTSHSGACAS
jgi:HD-GYP domain-containing protein (c-di-GMP phosphodiesterase class II)